MQTQDTKISRVNNFSLKKFQVSDNAGFKITKETIRKRSKAFPAHDSISNHTMNYRLGINIFRYVRTYLFSRQPLECMVYKGRNKQRNNNVSFLVLVWQKRDVNICSHKNLYINVHSSFIPNSPTGNISKGELLCKLRCICSKKYNLAITRNNLFATTGKILQELVLSDKSWSEKDINICFHFIQYFETTKL